MKLVNRLEIIPLTQTHGIPCWCWVLQRLAKQHSLLNLCPVQIWALMSVRLLVSTLILYWPLIVNGKKSKQDRNFLMGRPHFFHGSLYANHGKMRSSHEKIAGVPRIFVPWIIKWPTLSFSEAYHIVNPSQVEILHTAVFTAATSWEKLHYTSNMIGNWSRWTAKNEVNLGRICLLIFSWLKRKALVITCQSKESIFFCNWTIVMWSEDHRNLFLCKNPLTIKHKIPFNWRVFYWNCFDQLGKNSHSLDRWYLCCCTQVQNEVVLFINFLGFQNPLKLTYMCSKTSKIREISVFLIFLIYPDFPWFCVLKDKKKSQIIHKV